jgi:hypothetical protein
VLRAMLGASVLVHAGLLGGATAGRRLAAPAERPPQARSARLAERVAERTLPVSLREARRELVERARADRVKGRLALGEFLLQASQLDAREERRAFDLDRARALWTDRLDGLRAHADDLHHAIPEVFADLHYYGRPGRSMGDALLEGGGACEALTHLIVAAVHDTGHPDRAGFRFYGGETEGGTTHVAPVLRDGAGEIDLLTGAASTRTGALLAGADIVDAYARAHGVDPPLLPAPGAGTGSPAEDAEHHPRSSMVDGYPPNADRYPGTVPLYAGRAVRASGGPSAPPAVVPTAQPADCAYFLRKAVLDPPSLVVSPPGEVGFAGFPVELRRVPTAAQLERTFAMVDAVERSLAPGGAADEPAERLVALACLTALYDAAAADLALSSEDDLARLAMEKRHKAAGKGERLLTGVDWSGAEGQRLLGRLSGRFAGRSWLLLVLPGGDAPVMRLGGEAGRDDWGRTDALAALLVAPATRNAELSLVGALPRRAQIDVMHEVFHAHDHQRPWASSYALDGAGELASWTEFASAYRVFRGLAWGLWEAARPQDEVLAALLRAAAAERLDRGWVASLLEYYARNVLGLHQLRPTGAAVARSLARWLEEHGFADLEVYPTTLAVARDLP